MLLRLDFEDLIKEIVYSCFQALTMMDGAVWTQAVGTILATLEYALLEGSSVNMPLTANSATGFSRKHTQKALSSDAVSDVEMPGSPVKRRRDSASSTPPTDDNDDCTKPSAKCRKISSVLSRQFARSLSVSNGDGSGGNNSGSATMALNYLPLTSGIAVDATVSSAFSSSSSSSSLSSLCMLPSHSTDRESALFTSRALVYPAANRSTKAREKNQDSANDFGLCGGNGIQQVSQSSLDMDNSDGIADGDVFSALFQSLTPQLDRVAGAESVQTAVQQWAVAVAQMCAVDESPTVLVRQVDYRVSRLKELLPTILAHLCSDRTSTDSAALLQQSGVLRELCQAICEATSIGEWLLQRQFRLLPLFVPGVANNAHALAMLCQATKMARVCKDMYSLVQWTPQFSQDLGEMAGEYEEMVRGKHALYGDIVAQGGLTWKAAGLPVDSTLLTHVKQWMESTSGYCLSQIAHVYERRAKTSSVYSDEMLSADALLHRSMQILQSTALSVATCGDSFSSLTPHVMYIAAECTAWTCSKFKERQQRYQGMQLCSRAMRLLAAGESIVKLLSLVKAILVGTSTLSVLDVSVRIDQADDVLAALESLGASLVE
ncbi:hypothetical protein GGI20_003437, partial [Coemansia sp. BCRC 34301]